ncbi:MAG: 3',5'-cyclic-nucleotide phosphodiesterase [Pyrinomonadaceae bacterium]|nr:3',5'-cyclic-nucleotide phosphodiesterase [Pyrinomonadaceae bacterium]
MKIKLLPTTFNHQGQACSSQHLSCFLVDDCIAIDAGSLATATTVEQKKVIRDIILTHAHLDHVAGLPIFIDDLFMSLSEPVRVYGLKEVIQILEENLFNWKLYPRFSELTNSYGKVLTYRCFNPEESFSVKHLTVKAIEVNHKVPSIGLVISDGKSKLAITGDTANTEKFWNVVNSEENLSAVFIECAFPNELAELAASSYHLTPNLLEKELKKLDKPCPIYIINIKPMHREKVISELKKLNNPRIKVLEVGKTYNF